MDFVSSTEWAKALNLGDQQKLAEINTRLTKNGATLMRDRHDLPPSPPRARDTTLNDLQTAFDRGFEAVKAYIDAEFATLRKRVTAIEGHEAGPVGVSRVHPVIAGYVEDRLWRTEERIDEIERNYLRWGGTHTPGKTYKKNSLVARRGLWVSKSPTDDLPGDGATDWQLIHKNPPRDGGEHK